MTELELFLSDITPQKAAGFVSAFSLFIVIFSFFELTNFVVALLDDFTFRHTTFLCKARHSGTNEMPCRYRRCPYSDSCRFYEKKVPFSIRFHRWLEKRKA